MMEFDYFDAPKLKTVQDVENIKRKLSDIFPDAIRGSVAKSRWGKGRKQLHLSYWIAPDTVGGIMVHAIKNLIYYVEWDTNMGSVYLFAESDVDHFVQRVREIHKGEKHKITRTVNMYSLVENSGKY